MNCETNSYDRSFALQQVTGLNVGNLNTVIFAH